MIFKVIDTLFSFKKPAFISDRIWSGLGDFCGFVLFVLTLILLIFCLLVVTGNYQWGSWNYRITVEIETPEGIKTGSAVRNVYISKSPALFGENNDGNRIEVTGESVVIDLGERGHVFSLIGGTSYYELLKAFPELRSGSWEEKINVGKRILKVGKTAELKNYALGFVSFEDMKNPKSVRFIKGAQFNIETQKIVPVDDFELFFGQGVRVHRVIIEVTDDPVTWGIVDKYLPEKFYRDVAKNWMQLPPVERRRLASLIRFKQGEP